MAITKIILQQMVTMDQNSITASKYPKYTVVLSNSISSITAGELTAAIESSKASAAAAKQSEINAKQSELNAKDSENEAEISAASSQQSATQAASSATASANSAKAAKTSETNAKASETAAKTSETNAKASETAAKTSETNANSSKTAAAASASAAKTSETNAAASASAAKTSETNANSSKTAAANSASAAKVSETNAKTSETNAAASATKAENVASGMRDSIGLGNSARDCPDISGNPSAYIGFMRIREGVPGWPSIADGEAYLTGVISVNDGSPSYTGIFQGWGSRSLYTYRWASNLGPQWTRHARKDEVNRLVQIANDQTRLYAGNGTTYMEVGNNRAWGVYDSVLGKWLPLDIVQGGTGGSNAGQARTNLQVFHELKVDLADKNINELTGEYSGVYRQTTNAKAIADNGYPVEAAGSLIVLINGANKPSGCIQIYYPYNDNKKFYIRFYDAATNTWKAWIQWNQPENTDEFRGRIGLGSGNSPSFSTLNLRSTFGAPLLISSATPTIRFDETDRPAGSPRYEFVFDGGNWRIQKGGEGYNGEYVFSYSYRTDQMDLPNVRANLLSVPTAKLQQTKDSLLIPNTGLSRWYDYNAPAGAEAKKYYPVIISHPAGWNGDAFVEVSMRTRSLSGSQEPNCNMIHMWIRDAGWSDMGQGAFGHYHCYDSGEVAILCIRGTDKGQYPHNAIYVRGDAFPIRLAATVGSTISIPTSDWTNDPSASDKAVYKWGIENDSDGTGSTYGVSNLLTFAKGRNGFYSNYDFVDRGGYKYLKDGITDGGTITLNINNLVNNGKVTSNNGFIAQGDIVEEFSFISKMTDPGVTQTLGQAEFRAGTNQAQIVARDMTSAANHKFFNFNLDGTFSSPSGMVTHTGIDWNAQQTDNINKFKPIAGSVNGPEHAGNMVYGGMHLGFSGSYALQVAGRKNNAYIRTIESGSAGEWLKLVTATLAPKIPTDARDGFISDNAGDTLWAPSNGGGFQASYAENRIMQGWVDGAGRLYSRFLTTNQPTTPKTDVPWKSAAMLEMDNRFTGNNTFIGDILCSAANPLTLKSANPTLSFVESDADSSTYMFVSDGGGFRLNRDNTAGAEIFNYSRSQNNLKLGVSSYFTLNTRFDQGWTSRGSVDVTTTGYSTVTITTTASTDGVGARNQFEVNPSTNQFYLARRNRSNLTGQWIINFPSAGGTLALSGTSDINYKTNIEEYDGIHSIENIKAMDLVTFVFKDDEKKRTRRGVIAQQIEQIDPTYVKHTYEPCGEPIVDDEGVIQGYTDTKERVVLDNNVLLLDTLCAIKVLAQRDEEKTERINKLEKDVEDLKTVVEHLLTTMKNS